MPFNQLFTNTIRTLISLSLILQTITPLWLLRPVSAAEEPHTPQPAQTEAISRQSVSSPPERSPLSNFFADLNGDQNVDDNDLNRISIAWNCATGDACYDADLDHNSDGIIDVLDLAAVGNEFDIAAPEITITSPTADALLTAADLTVSGSVVDDHAITAVLVNGITATLTVNANGADFEATLNVTDGFLPIQVAAVNELGQTASEVISVLIDGEGPYITVHDPPHQQSVYTVRPTFDIDYIDLATTVNGGTAQVTLTDESQTATDITAQLAIDNNGANGTINFDLTEDESYTLTISVNDATGNTGTIETIFYVPQNPGSLTQPAEPEDAGYVSGFIYDSSTCAGQQQYDPISCTGIPGAEVTLALVDAADLETAREARDTDLENASEHLPATASGSMSDFSTDVVGTVVTGPNGFFSFPVAQTGNYALRVNKDGYTYGQRLADIVLEKSTPTTDIFITPLDSAVTP